MQHIWPYLKVHISSIIDKKFQAQGSVGGDGSKVQGGKALFIGLIDIGAIVDQFIRHGILAHVTGNVKCSVAKGIWFINL